MFLHVKVVIMDQRHRGRYYPRAYHHIRRGGFWQKTKDWVRDKMNRLRGWKEQVESNPLGKKVVDLAAEEAKKLTGMAHDKLVEKVGGKNAGKIEDLVKEGVQEVTGVKLGGTKRKSMPVTTTLAPPKKRRRRKKRVVAKKSAFYV